MKGHISHSRDSSAVSELDLRNEKCCEILFSMFSFLGTILFFDVMNILTLPFLPFCLFPHFCRCFKWVTLSPKEIIPLICVVFSTVAGKNASALPVQSSGSKGALCQVELSETCVTTTPIFCSCKSSFVFLSSFSRCCVCTWAKLKLKVLLFYSAINHRKSAYGTVHFPECGGVLHRDCSSHLAWLMFARCAV